MKPSLSQRLGGVIHIGTGGAPPGVTDDDETSLGCCFGSAVYGPTRCTCWEPVYDVAQAEPCAIPDDVPARRRRCHDCAYRKDSPERAAGEGDALEDLGSRGVFACHQGMRRVIAYRHPDGRELPAADGDYAPPQLGTVAFKADGTPAEWCAGWAAHARRAGRTL